jgi:hypothetical protein
VKRRFFQYLIAFQQLVRQWTGRLMVLEWDGDLMKNICSDVKDDGICKRKESEYNMLERARTLLHDVSLKFVAHMLIEAGEALLDASTLLSKSMEDADPNKRVERQVKSATGEICNNEVFAIAMVAKRRNSLQKLQLAKPCKTTELDYDTKLYRAETFLRLLVFTISDRAWSARYKSVSLGRLGHRCVFLFVFLQLQTLHYVC